MDRIIKNYINDFVRNYGIKVKDESKLFELFSSFCVTSQLYQDEFEVEDIVTGDGEDCGIDAIAIISNGILIDNEEVVDDLIENNNGLFDTKFIFVQSKTSEKFQSKDMRNFGDGVVDVLSEEPKMTQNSRIKDKCKIINKIYDNIAKLKENPECYLYYVTLGKWKEEKTCVNTISRIIKSISDLNILSKIEFNPIDDVKLQDLYKDIINEPYVTIKISNKVLLPEIENIKESHIGYIDYIEFIKLLDNGKDGIKESIFYDNVRSYQGDATINKEIDETIRNNSSQFVLMNNGVTIISKNIRTNRDNFILTNYQIVNGCQTSHILYNYKNNEEVNKRIQIPIKIIETTDEDIINQIIKSTNRQTSVTSDQFLALTSFQKKLEEYYNSFDNEARLYYERRSKQYCFDRSIEKNRIVSIQSQIKTVASMFFDCPHKATRYYGKLVNDIKGIFDEDNKLIIYYTSSFVYYNLEKLFRENKIDSKYRKYRYFILTIIKHSIIGSYNRYNSKEIDRKCEELLENVKESRKFFATVKKAISIIDKNVQDLNDTENTKNASLVKTFIKSIEG